MNNPATHRTFTTHEDHMSNTIVDMPKVTQMLDNGWTVRIFKNDLNSYTAIASTDSELSWSRFCNNYKQTVRDAGNDEDVVQALMDAEFEDAGEVTTDDWTPEQALTRLAYKVHGEIL